ncbi:MAG TPA: amino acid ABC transporter substrate-binding protein [Candidatus Sulfotelmatobacter sp.]|nr:amino acid ABC transporter substrate-binding protein [Candidatus Sulfotelmatobacter sp.]
MNRLRFLSASGAAALAPALQPLPAAAQGAPIVVGASLSLTGIFADGGKYSLEGYQLWIKQQNAKGGVLGRQLALKYYDDQSDPATGVRLYERLINEDKVDVIMGPYGTAITAPAANVAERYKMPMICPETADVAMFQRGFRYIFQGLGPVQTYLFGVLSIAHDHHFKSLAVIGPDTAFAHSLADAVPGVARGFGQAVVYQEFYPARASDFSSVIEKVKAANPDVLLAMAFPNDSIGVLRQLKVSNYAPKMFYEAIGPSDPRFAESAGADVDGVFSVTGWDAAGTSRENQAFKSSYRAEFHRDPDYHAASNFSALEVLAAAIKSAGSLDHDKLRDALAAVRIKTLLGEWRVDPRTGIQLGYTSYILQWQKGKQVIVYPGNAAHGKPIVPFPAWSGR